MAQIETLIRNLLTRTAKSPVAADRAEAKALLARLNDDRPRFAVAQPKKAKKGSRT